jgi:hypothetical protein
MVLAFGFGLDLRWAMNSFGSPGGGQSLRVPTVGKSLNSKGPATKKKEQRNISDILEAEKYGLMKLSLFTQIFNCCINIVKGQFVPMKMKDLVTCLPQK